MKYYSNIFTYFLFICFFLSSLCSGKQPAKIIICGVARNVEPTINNTIESIEALGKYIQTHFDDYAVLIYENNSVDRTAEFFQKWADKNQRVHFISEFLDGEQLPPHRTGKIARARNVILSMIRNPTFKDFDYIVMADLDFPTPWPVEEICNTIATEGDWDCICANGMNFSGFYCDRYAFRDKNLPFGPELAGNEWWNHLASTAFKLEGNEWVPVYAAFGGMAIFKTASISDCVYSGIVTKDLEQYYGQIIASLPLSNQHLKKYLNKNGFDMDSNVSTLPLIFGDRTDCCEHVPFFASMAIRGHGNFYINPKMILYYPD